jgi:hypothetical protein
VEDALAGEDMHRKESNLWIFSSSPMNVLTFQLFLFDVPRKAKTTNEKKKETP